MIKIHHIDNRQLYKKINKWLILPVLQSIIDNYSFIQLSHPIK